MEFHPYEAAEEAAAFLRSKAPAPSVAIVLGSGLGAFAEQLSDPTTISYSEIPGFPMVSIVGHAGHLRVGRLGVNGPWVAALSGRVHLYEGQDVNLVVHPVRTLGRWGVKTVVLTNAAGAIRSDWSPGDLMLITDHINMTGLNPLTGHNDDRLGVRFPDMSTTYEPAFCELMRAAANVQGVALREGVYVGLKGPSYETPAEIRMLQAVGADAVGMSTVCEVIAARHMGVRIAGVSCITNYAAGLADTPLNHAEVKATAAQSRDAFLNLLNEGLAQIAKASASD